MFGFEFPRAKCNLRKAVVRNIAVARGSDTVTQSTRSARLSANQAPKAAFRLLIHTLVFVGMYKHAEVFQWAPKNGQPNLPIFLPLNEVEALTEAEFGYATLLGHEG